MVVGRAVKFLNKLTLSKVFFYANPKVMMHSNVEGLFHLTETLPFILFVLLFVDTRLSVQLVANQFQNHGPAPTCEGVVASPLVTEAMERHCSHW